MEASSIRIRWGRLGGGAERIAHTGELRDVTTRFGFMSVLSEVQMLLNTPGRVLTMGNARR